MYGNSWYGCYGYDGVANADTGLEMEGQPVDTLQPRLDAFSTALASADAEARGRSKHRGSRRPARRGGGSPSSKSTHRSVTVPSVVDNNNRKVCVKFSPSHNAVPKRHITDQYRHTSQQKTNNVSYDQYNRYDERTFRNGCDGRYTSKTDKMSVS